MLLADPELDDPLERHGFTKRDRTVLALARKHVASSRDFGDALRALREATERLIPAGRVYFLGERSDAPIIGSIVSGIGIAHGARGIELVRVAHGRPQDLGTWDLR